ncbi:hypothetical protein GEMMAAP_01740 [Gemmatimonas phototrophica]|uniref:Uncharacterized protein n=1 Tax=Gemmatimonas phototrophica TaxID=1379270 RepID=A0A143BHI0_9BACT|nr:hypothetical protein GEMMAAP_01740 [Gemmatimonas phototrophica]
MAMGALFGGVASGLHALASRGEGSDVDWVERIRVGVVFICAYVPLLRYLRDHHAASTWYAFVGGALIMYSLVLLLQLIKGPSRPSADKSVGETDHSRRAERIAAADGAD